MAIEFYEEKNGFTCTSEEVDDVNYTFKNLGNITKEEYEEFLSKLKKIDNVPTERSIRLLCVSGTAKGIKVARKFWDKNENPFFWYSYRYGKDWERVFCGSNHFLAETKDGELFFVAPSVIPVLATTCKLEDGGWYKGKFIFKKIGKFASLYPVK